MVFGVLVGLAVTRHLGPERFGELSVALALLALAAPVTDVGLTAFLRTELLARRIPAERLLATVAGLRVAGGIFAMLAVAGLAWHAGGQTLALCVAAMGSLFNPLLTMPEQWFSARLESRAAAIPQIVALIAASALRLGLIAIDAPLWAFAACLSFEALAGGVWLFASLRARQTFGFRDYDADLARRALRASLPLLLTVAALALQSRVDQLVIARNIGATDLGLYASAIRFSELANIALSALCTSLLPRFMASRETCAMAGPDGLQELADKLVTVALAWAIFCSATAWLWLPALLGEAFRPAAGLVAVHAWSAVFLAMGLARSTLWTVQGRNHLTLLATVAGSVLSVGLNFILTPRFGAWAAIWISLAASVVANLLLSLIAPGGGVMAIQLRSLFGARRALRALLARLA